jgi:hypothetical protein
MGYTTAKIQLISITLHSSRFLPRYYRVEKAFFLHASHKRLQEWLIVERSADVLRLKPPVSTMGSSRALRHTCPRFALQISASTAVLAAIAAFTQLSHSQTSRFSGMSRIFMSCSSFRDPKSFPNVRPKVDGCTDVSNAVDAADTNELST